MWHTYPCGYEHIHYTAHYVIIYIMEYTVCWTKDNVRDGETGLRSGNDLNGTSKHGIQTETKNTVSVCREKASEKVKSLFDASGL